MPTEVIEINGERDYWDSINYAARIIHNGGLVAFPTETVYGVGTRGDLPDSVARLREVKGRTETKPFTVHIGRSMDASLYVPTMSGYARRFVRKAWPGPVTIVFSVTDAEQSKAVQEFGTQCLDLLYFEETVGIRCPADKIALDLLSTVAAPVVAASANRATMSPPRTADEVIAELGDDVDLLINGGACRYAQASTVVKLGEAGYDVLREGVVDARILERFGSLNILFVCSGNTCRSPMAEAMCRRRIADHLGCDVDELGGQGVFVQSAGSCCCGGSPASEGALEAMSARSLDLRKHVARGLSAEMVDQADHVFCMTRAHLDAVLSLSPQAAERAELLGGDEEISDPFGCSVGVYVDCAERIGSALERKLAEIGL